MSYNLTPTQEKAVQWLVEKTESGDLAENEVLYSYSTDGGVAVQNDRDNVELPSFITKGIFDVLAHEGLVHVRTTSKGSYKVTLSGQAYDAVENDFEKGENDVSAEGQTILNLHGDFHGDNARVNFQSEDNSINIVDKTADELFEELRKTIETNLHNSPDKELLTESVESMEQAETKSSYLKAYGSFIGLAADHVGLLEPFFGALWQLYQNF